MTEDAQPTRFPQEEDRPPLRLAAWAALATLAVVGASLAALAVCTRSTRERTAAPAGRPAAISDVLQTEFAPASRARLAPASGAAAPPERLQGFAWVDRERGTVRIPIEDAMRLWLRSAP
jgi:hypothetical protein